MNAKQTAEELIRKFIPHTVSNLGGDQTWENARQCALVCVMEYINFADAHWVETNWNRDQNRSYEFWEEVKKALEILTPIMLLSFQFV